MSELAAITAELGDVMTRRVVVEGVGLVGARDPGSTGVVYTIVVLLVLGGIGLGVFAWWLVRTTRPDPELLAPLEAIESRRWRRLDPAGQRRLLDELRPEGADPLDMARSEPDVDEDFSADVDLRDVRELSDDDPRAGGAAEVSDGDEASDSDEVNGSDDAGDTGGELDPPMPSLPGEVGLWAQLPPPSAGDGWAVWDERLGVPTDRSAPSSGDDAVESSR